MKKLLSSVALMLCAQWAAQAQVQNVSFRQNVEAVTGDFEFYMMGHNAPPPACSVSDLTNPYSTVYGVSVPLNASTTPWKGAGASWFSRIFMMNRRTGESFDFPFCTTTAGTYALVFSGGTIYYLTVSGSIPLNNFDLVLNP